MGHLWANWYVKATMVAVVAVALLVVLGFWAVTGGILGDRGGLVEGEAIGIVQRLVKEKQPTLLSSTSTRWAASYRVDKGAKCGEWRVLALQTVQGPVLLLRPLTYEEHEIFLVGFTIDDCTGRVTDCQWRYGPVPTWCIRKP